MLEARVKTQVLGHAVHLVGEAGIVGHGRPGGGEPLVGLATEQQCVACLQLAPFELRRFVVEERTGPLARLLEHSVER